MICGVGFICGFEFNFGQIWSSYGGLLVVNADTKAVDKASAIRSKHSVTEQRRRSKINERYVQQASLLHKFSPQCQYI